MDRAFVGLLQPGDMIGNSYRIEILLGKGGLGEVWVARHLKLPNKRVAVKVLRTEGETLTGSLLQRFRKEADVASNLNHPHIVNIYDYNLTPSGHPFIVMEFLDGESLGARLQRGPLTLAETRTVLRQTCSALDMAHNQGILHYDLKPSNIFLTTQGSELCVKVLNFGISKILDCSSYTQNFADIISSPRYMSPEHARGENNCLTPQSDIFSLGSVVYEMLSGKHAFRGDDVVQVLYRIVHEAHEPLKHLLPDLPEEPLSAVETALKKQPKHRHLSAMAFSEAFDKNAYAPTDLTPNDVRPPEPPNNVRPPEPPSNVRPPERSSLVNPMPLPRPPSKDSWGTVFFVGIVALFLLAVFAFIVGTTFVLRHYFKQDPEPPPPLTASMPPREEPVPPLKEPVPPREEPVPPLEEPVPPLLEEPVAPPNAAPELGALDDNVEAELIFAATARKSKLVMRRNSFVIQS